MIFRLFIAAVAAILFTNHGIAQAPSSLETRGAEEGCVIGGISLKTMDPRLINEIMLGKTGARELLSRNDIRSTLEIIPEKDRITALELLIGCIKLQAPPRSRITTKGNDSVILMRNGTPIDLFNQIFCSDEDFRSHVDAVKTMRSIGAGSRESKDADSASMEDWFEDTFPGMLTDGEMRKIIRGESKRPSCPPPGSCSVRGTIPIRLYDEYKNIFGRNYRKIEVEQGFCKYKTGYIDEAMISY